MNINFNNIRDDYDYNFQKHEGSLTYDVPYDAKSVMHYSSKAFTKDNNLYTITSKVKMTIQIEDLMLASCF